MRVAAIDVGTNTVRLLVGEPDGAGGFRPVFAAQEITRLGQGLLPDRELKTEPWPGARPDSRCASSPEVNGHRLTHDRVATLCGELASSTDRPRGLRPIRRWSRVAGRPEPEDNESGGTSGHPPKAAEGR